MHVLFLDENFETFKHVELFKSFIWTERYEGYGDFELYIPLNNDIINLTNTIREKQRNGYDTYVYYDSSEVLMIAETIEIRTDSENGVYAIITGRSLESILDRRIIWKQTSLNGYLQGQIKKLIDQNIISPENGNRRISNFVFVESADPNITKLKVSAQFTGDNLYDVILALCKSFNIGFKITKTNDNNLAFQLYSGTDRSYDQNVFPYIVFSKEFDNLLRTDYFNSVKPFKNVALVSGEDQGNQRRAIEIDLESRTGLGRRELFVDARDIQSETEEGPIPDNEYYQMLTQRGNEYLSDSIYLKSFDGDVETNQMYTYGVDFYKGDIVQIVTDYGIKSKVRVDEYIRVQDINGFAAYPTFTILE